MTAGRQRTARPQRAARKRTAETDREGVADDPLHKAAVDANGDIRMRVRLDQLLSQVLKLDVVPGPGV
jgi:hypothetical protein